MTSVDRVKEICKERRIPISKLERECGFSNGYIRSLKEGKFPSDRLQVIASFLGVSVSYILNGEQDDSEGYYINDDARELAQFLLENPDYKVLFDASRKVKREDLQFVKEMIERLSR